MHEATVAKSILEIATSRIHIRKDAEVEAVKVRVGAFTNVDPESLAFAFDAMKWEFGSCRHAELKVEVVTAQALCHGQGHRYAPDLTQGYQCPQCGSGMGRLIEGNELEIVGCVISVSGAMELEDARIS